MTFEQFASAHGLQIAQLCPADRVQRCATVDKPRGKNGAFFWDGVRGWVSDWAQGGDIHWFEGGTTGTTGTTRPITAEERKAWAQRKRALEVRQEQLWRNAALAAGILLRACKPERHNYLHSKGLPDVIALVSQAQELVVPMRNPVSHELQGAQLIKWLPEERRWEKKMLPGMRAKGAVLRLGPRRAREAIFCEGYATGLSIEAAARQMRLSAAVVICFSDSNMAMVAGAHKDKDKSRGYCFADNDKSGAGERAAKLAGLPYCMSEVEGQDANDVHVKAGLMAVCELLMKARRM